MGLASSYIPSFIVKNRLDYQYLIKCYNFAGLEKFMISKISTRKTEVHHLLRLSKNHKLAFLVFVSI